MKYIIILDADSNDCSTHPVLICRTEQEAKGFEKEFNTWITKMYKFKQKELNKYGYSHNIDYNKMDRIMCEYGENHPCRMGKEFCQIILDSQIDYFVYIEEVREVKDL